MGNEWNQSDVAGSLNCDTQGALMLGTNTGAASRFDLCPVGYKPPDLVDILVIDDLDVLNAEGAYPAPRHKPSPRASAWTSTRPWPSLWPSALWARGPRALRCTWRPVRGFSRHIIPVPSDIGRIELRFPMISPRRANRQSRRKEAVPRLPCPGHRRSSRGPRHQRTRFPRGDLASAFR